MEQRIANLEEELKLLKNQIRSVLLDIKENLSGSDWQATPGQNQTVESPQQAIQPTEESDRMSKIFDDSRPLAGKTPFPAETVVTQAEGRPVINRPDLSSSRSACSEERSAPSNHNSHNHNDYNGYHDNHNEAKPEENRQEQRLEPLTLVMLINWLERCQAVLGREETGKLVELYASGRDLPEGTRQTLRLLLGLLQKDKTPSAAAVAIPFLLELDNLFQPHPEPASFQEMVMKMMLQNQVVTASKQSQFLER